MTTRRAFLIAGTLAAAMPHAAFAEKLNFDLDAFNALLDGAQSHKHLFAATEINGGEVLGAVRNTLNAYRDVGSNWNDVLPAVVLYHGISIVLGFDDTIWNRYVIPASHKMGPSIAKQIASVRKSGGSGNPCLRKQGGDNDTSIQSLVADAGTRFFVCNNAARGFSSYIATRFHIGEADVYDEVSRHLAPNAMLVPAGVWAVHAIQEQRFTLLQTSLPAPAA
jgi:hypothetical protein